MTGGTQAPGTTVRSRRLAGILAAYRKRAGLDQAAVARYVNHHKVWVSHVETPAWCRPSVGDVRALLALYGVTDPAETDRVVRLAVEVKQSGWWHDYDVTAALATLLSLEDEASDKRIWESAYVPGLLQTEEYARAVIGAGLDPVAARDADELVRVRMERQKALRRPSPLRLHCILDQAVLCRPAGPAALMRDQLRHLAAVAELENVTIQVLPFAAGPHPAMGAPFAVFSFPDPDDHDIVWTDTMNGPVYAEAQEHINRARRAFAHLAAHSLPEYESVGLAARLAADL